MQRGGRTSLAGRSPLSDKDLWRYPERIGGKAKEFLYQAEVIEIESLKKRKKEPSPIWMCKGACADGGESRPTERTRAWFTWEGRKLLLVERGKGRVGGHGRMRSDGSANLEVALTGGRTLSKKGKRIKEEKRYCAR